MSTLQFIFALALFAGLVGLSLWLQRVKRRRVALAQPFPEQWRRVLIANLPPYCKLAADIQLQLHGYVQEFLYDKSFEGCGGLELDDEIRVTIAGQACLLLLNRKVRCYPQLSSILVYPSTYIVRDEDGGDSVRLGESWRTGAVVLAWDSVKRGAANFADGHNLVIHEFAHQLDQEDGAGDGAPVLDARSSYTTWAKVLSTEYERLRKRVSGGRKSTLDAYGATNPAEFFAVASETFFEKPRQLQKRHPELFDELRTFYNIDPADWV